jgi:nitroreductase
MEVEHMHVDEATLKRRSVRKFKQQPIDDDIIDQLLKSAMAAPSACNKRPWEFYVIKNKDIQDDIRQISRYFSWNSTLMIIVAGNEKRSVNHRINDFWIQDCAAATENMLLTATSLGLGTCWCGLSPMVTPVKKVRKILNLEEHIIPLALIHIGYPDEELEPRTQYNQKRVHVIE